MSTLPEAWVRAPLTSVSELLRGVTYTKEVASSLPAQDRLPVLRANNLQGRAFDLTDLVYVPSRFVAEQQLVRAGDVVVATSSGSISVVGKAVQAQRDLNAGFGAFCAVLRPNILIESRYFGHFFSSDAYRSSVSAMARGVNINNLKREHFDSLMLPLAPRSEQQRIADKLDIVLARVDASRDRLARIALLLKRFRQSVLAAATSGRLTEGWRATATAGVKVEYKAEESPPKDAEKIPDSWSWVTVANLSRKVADGVHKKPNYVPAGIPFLTVKNLTAGPGISFERSAFVTLADHTEFCRRTHPQRDDILITKDGTLGVVRRVDTDREFSIFVSLALVKLKDRRSSKYVSLAFQAPVLQSQMVGVGTGLQHIHLTDLRQDLVPMPPLEEQAEIVRRVETLFAYAGRIEARLTQAQAATDRLTPALLAKAFRGELVQQDPNDEPASGLIKRLAANRSELGKKEKPRRAHAGRAAK